MKILGSKEEKKNEITRNTPRGGGVDSVYIKDVNFSQYKR